MSRPRAPLIGRNACSRAAAAHAPLTDVLISLTQVAEEQADTVVAAIKRLDETRGTLGTAAAPGLPASFSAATDNLRLSPGVATCANAAATNRVTCTQDIATAESWQGLAHLPLSIGLKAVDGQAVDLAAVVRLAADMVRPGAEAKATFSIDLPVLSVRAEAAETVDRCHPTRSEARDQARPDPAGRLADFSGLKILVVDDEADVRGLMRRLFEDCRATSSKRRRRLRRSRCCARRVRTCWSPISACPRRVASA